MQLHRSYLIPSPCPALFIIFSIFFFCPSETFCGTFYFLFEGCNKSTSPIYPRDPKQDTVTCNAPTHPSVSYFSDYHWGGGHWVVLVVVVVGVGGELLSLVFFVTVPKFPGFSLKETGHQYACFTITHCHLEWAEKLRYCSLIDLAGEVFWVSPPDTHCLYLQFSRILIIVVILMYTNILSVERKTTSTKNNIFEQPAPKFYKFASLFVNG